MILVRQKTDEEREELIKAAQILAPIVRAKHEEALVKKQKSILQKQNKKKKRSLKNLFMDDLRRY